MRSRSARCVSVFVLASLAASASRAVASCGSASCFLINHSEQGVEAAGTFRADVSFRYVDQTKKLRGSDSTDEVLVPGIDFDAQTIEPEHHREISTRNTTLQLDLAYGATSRISVFGVLPLVVDKNHEHFDDVGTKEEHFSNDAGTRGFGDVAVGARYAFLMKADDLLVGSLSVKLPTGAYQLLNGEAEINEPTIQPGTGSYDGLLSLYYARHRPSKPVEWFVAGSGRINGRNSLEYRVGDEYVVSAGASYAAGSRWIFSLQANARHGGRDDYRGSSVPSTGSDAISLTPGVRFRTGDGLELYGYVQLPAYQDVNEAQLAPRSGFIAGLSRSF